MSDAASGVLSQQSHLPKQTRGISGRVFVFLFVIFLIVSGIAMFSIAARFQTIMGKLEVVRSLWPKASMALKPRYSMASQEFADSTKKTKEWDTWFQEFEASSQFDRQSVAASELEDQIAIMNLDSPWRPTDFEESSVKQLLQADHERRLIQEDFLGRLTVEALRLKLPPIFRYSQKP
jgi:hypothetical protein